MEILLPLTTCRRLIYMQMFLSYSRSTAQQNVIRCFVVFFFVKDSFDWRMTRRHIDQQQQLFRFVSNPITHAYVNPITFSVYRIDGATGASGGRDREAYVGLMSLMSLIKINNVGAKKSKQMKLNRSTAWQFSEKFFHFFFRLSSWILNLRNSLKLSHFGHFKEGRNYFSSSGLLFVLQCTSLFVQQASVALFFVVFISVAFVSVTNGHPIIMLIDLFKWLSSSKSVSLWPNWNI